MSGPGPARLGAPDGVTGAPRSILRRVFRRGPWENLATALVALGVLMLMQPFSLSLYTYSFVTTLAGVLLFLVVTKFPS